MITVDKEIRQQSRMAQGARERSKGLAHYPSDNGQDAGCLQRNMSKECRKDIQGIAKVNDDQLKEMSSARRAYIMDFRYGLA